MRTIKFRTWNPIAKRMFYGIECYIFNSDLGLEAKVLWNGEEVDQIIQQYTGLDDKNGKEIYEGDIVKTCYDKYSVIIWGKDARFHVRQKDSSRGFDSGYTRYWEVAGNIFENPELLNTKE